VARIYMTMHWAIALVAYCILGILAFSPSTRNVLPAMIGVTVGFVGPYYVLNSAGVADRFASLFMRAPLFVGIGMVWYDVMVGVGGYWEMMYFGAMNEAMKTGDLLLYALGPVVIAVGLAIAPMYILYWTRSGVGKLFTWVVDGFKQ
jgi:hypothetical protein